MARHYLHTFVDDGTSEMARAADTVAGRDDQTSAAVEHVSSDVIDIGTLDRTRASDNDVIRRIHTVAAGAVGAKQVVPAVVINKS